jgi:peptidoglycan/LPS O-acetylase OafA/YrhL
MSDLAATAPDNTAMGKAHYEVLDGLRGTAAIMVVLFHIMGMAAGWADSGQLLHHAALAVDFFFALSGFVIAYAYDDRWASMTTSQFIATRLIRLHPLVILGAVLGLLSFVFDPFADNQKIIPLAIVLRDFALACLILPHAALPNRWTDSHSLNSPAWSLMQEYIGNLAYVLLLRRLKTGLLGVVVVIAAWFVAHMVWSANSMDQGSDWTTIWGAPTRMAFSFTLGLWLYRVRHRFAKVGLGWAVLSMILAAAFAMPLVPKAIPHGNGLYEAAMVALLFPLIILCGAHSNIGTLEMRVCKFAGRISYPLYILHYPFLLVNMNFVLFKKPSTMIALMADSAAFVTVMGFAWLAMKLYDEPVRKWLKRRITDRQILAPPR